MPQEVEKTEQAKKATEKAPVKKPYFSTKSSASKERDWADRTEETSVEPYEETYRDGSMKNECW
ncbi:MAG: hypothetical protein IKH57_18200 [Clostridia bacterium]|nr:hypothetical protein [Clostridia bacterium]